MKSMESGDTVWLIGALGTSFAATQLGSIGARSAVSYS